MKKAVFYFAGLVIGVFSLILMQTPSAKARMVVCDVGQGDAILIIKGSIQVLIDGGPSTEKILSCLEKQLPFYDRRIELIVLTNTDFDHMNGLVAVVERYSVMQFVTADGVHQSDILDKFTKILSATTIVPTAVKRGDRIKVEDKKSHTDLEFDVLWPPDTINEYVSVFRDDLPKSNREQILGASAKRGNLNERSVVLLLLEDGKKILLTGDAGDQAEKELIKLGELPDIDILKVGHHGSKYASTLDFLQIIRPELAVISVGEKNRYGHPTPETLERLSKIGAQVKRTDEDGSIVIDL